MCLVTLSSTSEAQRNRNPGIKEVIFQRKKKPNQPNASKTGCNKIVLKTCANAAKVLDMYCANTLPKCDCALTSDVCTLYYKSLNAVY